MICHLLSLLPLRKLVAEMAEKSHIAQGDE